MADPPLFTGADQLIETEELLSLPTGSSRTGLSGFVYGVYELGSKTQLELPPSLFACISTLYGDPFSRSGISLDVAPPAAEVVPLHVQVGVQDEALVNLIV
jgi:hypothetical protein